MDADASPPTSKSEVRACLLRLGLSPHKRFGQNFLADRGILDRIVAAANLVSGDVVLEVGPGLGTLTARLIAAGVSVVGAEIDRGLARHLSETFAGDSAFELVVGDVLDRGRVSPMVLAALSRRETGRGFRVVSNLPYGISSPFIAALLTVPGQPPPSTLLLQREFGDALVAAPRSEGYSALSVWAQTCFETGREFAVPRSAFHPAPDVDSVVVTLKPRAGRPDDPAAFGGFVKRLFQQRRKMLSSALLPIAGSARAAGAALAEVGVTSGERAEALAPERIVALWRAVRRAMIA